jgi:predicted type IV restriction endonuclease
MHVAATFFTKVRRVGQAYNYALEKGIRYVAITNGDYYLIRDRLKGLSYEANVLGEFTLSALQDEDLALIDGLKPGRLGHDDVRSVLTTLAECF